jgi:hypothetical protein
MIMPRIPLSGFLNRFGILHSIVPPVQQPSTWRLHARVLRGGATGFPSARHLSLSVKTILPGSMGALQAGRRPAGV